MDPKATFTLVLPSNSNMHSHPDNRPGDYTVRLSHPITLTGDWDVALANIHYPPNWFDFREKANVNWIFSRHRISTPLSELGQCVKVVYDPNANKFEVTILEQDWQYGTDVVHGSCIVWPGHYESVQDIGAHLCKMVEDGIKLAKKQTRVSFHFDHDTRAGMIHTEEGSLFLFTDKQHLALMLGQAYAKIVPRESRPTVPQPTTEDVTVPGVPIPIPDIYMLTGPGKSRFAKIDSVYVYSDIVENQRIGDTEAPLLGIIPVQKKNNEEKQFFVLNPPAYLPVNKSEIDEVGIALRTARGEPIPFPKFSSNVICTLQFRRRKSQH